MSPPKLTPPEPAMTAPPRLLKPFSPPTPPALQALTGHYVSDDPWSGSFRVTAQGEALFVNDVSPDGKLAAFPTLEHSGEHKEMLALVETDGSKAAKLVAFERPRFGLLHFSRDGKGVIYPVRDSGVDNLWLQPLDGSKGKQITDFTSEHIFDFHWSFDGKRLALVRGHTDADVVLIRDGRQ